MGNSRSNNEAHLRRRVGPSHGSRASIEQAAAALGDRVSREHVETLFAPQSHVSDAHRQRAAAVLAEETNLLKQTPLPRGVREAADKLRGYLAREHDLPITKSDIRSF